MFFNLNTKSEINIFSICENHIGIVPFECLNKASSGVCGNKSFKSAHDFANNNISSEIINYINQFRTVTEDFNFSKIKFIKDTIVCCISIPCNPEEQKKFVFIYNGQSLLFIDYHDFLLDFFKQVLDENIDTINESQDFIYYILKAILKHDLENLNSISQNLSLLELNILTDSSNYNYNADQILVFRGNSLKLHHYYIILMDICRSLSKEKSIISSSNQQLFESLCDQIQTLSNESQHIWEYTSQIRDVYQQKLSVNQNNIMKVLTIVTTIFMPLTLITRWYGMNFEYMKELHWKYGYPLLFFISVVIVGVLCIVFKKKKWL